MSNLPSWLEQLRKTEIVQWNQQPSWRPVFIILSYLLASPTLDIEQMIKALEELLIKLGRGQVTVLYTNSERPEANEHYPDLRTRLCKIGFEILEDNTGIIEVERMRGTRKRPLKYALFHRLALDTLTLGDN